MWALGVSLPVCRAQAVEAEWNRAQIARGVGLSGWGASLLVSLANPSDGRGNCVAYSVGRSRREPVSAATCDPHRPGFTLRSHGDWRGVGVRAVSRGAGTTTSRKCTHGLRPCHADQSSSTRGLGGCPSLICHGLPSISINRIAISGSGISAIFSGKRKMQ